MARIAVELGREMGLPEDELSDIYLAGLLHDVGKIGIRDASLQGGAADAPRSASTSSSTSMIGYRILADLHADLATCCPACCTTTSASTARATRTAWLGEAIPLLARILAVADSYDAMSTRPPYRDAMPLPPGRGDPAQGAGHAVGRPGGRGVPALPQKVHAIRQRGVGESLWHAIDGALRSEESSAFPVRLPRFGR